jgi:hypothetical protein
MKKLLVLLPVTALLLLASKCPKKDSNDYNYNQDHRDYFSATFDNYFSPDETGMMIFLSDMEGNLLASASIDGKTQVYLTRQGGGLFPDHIIETLVYKGPVAGDKQTVYLYSYLSILPASWIWTTFENENTGQAYLNFSNIPQHLGYSLSSNYQWDHGTALSSSISFGLGKNPDNAYLLLKTTSDGYRYKWITGLTNAHTTAVSLSAMDTPITRSIPIPGTFAYSYKLSGYLPSGEHAKGMYALDYEEGAGTYTDSATLHFPGTIFADFQFLVNTVDATDPHKQWYQYNFGTVPNRVDHLNGNITVQDSLPNQFQVQTSGIFDRLGSTWVTNPLGPYRYQWTVYGSPEATTFQFPSLPLALAQELTGFTTDSLKLINVEIKDFSDIDSYDDLIKSMFVSGNYIANIVPQYSGLIYNMAAVKSFAKHPHNSKDF